MNRAVFVVSVLGLCSGAIANERHFTYAYETAVLPPGARELAVWTTPRIGKDTFYPRFDQRVEFEVGLTDRLMTAFYLNATAKTAQAATGLASELELGVASEWKLKLLDPVADPFGLALYAEIGGTPA